MRRLRRPAGFVLVLVAVLLKAALFIPLPLFIIQTNLDARRHDAEYAALLVNRYERECAEALLSGQPLADFEVTVNERRMMEMLIKGLDEPFETIALGSSRILQLTEELAHSDDFFNCGVSGADYQDVMGIFYQFDKAGMLPKNVIIGLDPWLLNADENMLSGRGDPAIFEEFLALKLGYNNGYVPPEPEPEPDEWTLRWQMLDIALFQQNYGRELAELPPGEALPLAQGDVYNSNVQNKMPDGSVLYPANFRNDDEATVEMRALTEATTFLRMDDYMAPDAGLCELFDRWVRYMQSQGINVILVLMPYHPIVYNYAMENADYYPGFFLTEPWFREYAASRGMPIYGSYNPFVTNMDFGDFYDGLHIRGEAIPKLFPGVQQALYDAAHYSGAPSLDEMHVDYEMAERLVTSRYQIYAPEVVRRGEDEEIAGEGVYVVERYASDAPGAVRLARYAVVKHNGLVYRYDDFEGWVVDKRVERQPSGAETGE